MRLLSSMLALTCLAVSGTAQCQKIGDVFGSGGDVIFFDDRIAGKKTAQDILEVEGWTYTDHHVCLATENCGRTIKRDVTVHGALNRQTPNPTQMTLVGYKQNKGTRAFVVIDIPCLEGIIAAKETKVVTSLNLMGCFGGYTLLGRALIENQYAGDTDGWRRIAQQTFQTQKNGKWNTDFSVYLEDFSYGRELISDGWGFGERVLITNGDGTVLHDDTSESWAIPASSSETVSKAERCEAYAKSRSSIMQLVETVASGQCQNMWESGLIGWISGGAANAGTTEGNHSAGFSLSFSPPDPCGNMQEMYAPADEALYAYLYDSCLDTPDTSSGDPDVDVDLSFLEEFGNDIVEVEGNDNTLPNMGGNSCPDSTTTLTMVINGEQCTVTETTECDADCNCDTTEVIVCGG